ncbi:hypothetical protein [Candidatus Poriferisodalis sp.]|uniref:hypothetical protein n=1 Tax=Candidatus Poriferisodalis sp. TaxID=3101277 RepID=UPI003B01BD77
MSEVRTGAERYFASRHKNAEYHAAYLQAKAEIDSVDAVVREVQKRQQALGLDLDDLAARASVPRRELRRLMSPQRRAARFKTVTAVAAALGLTVRLELLDSATEPLAAAAN